MNPQFLIHAFKKANRFLLEKLEDMAITFKEGSDERRLMLLRCAQTSLNSKLLAHYKEFFAEMVVEAVEKLDRNLLDKNLIGIKQVLGGSIKESRLIDGVAFKRTFSYAGFE
jgi:T-complex protein 1 subunit eta